MKKSDKLKDYSILQKLGQGSYGSVFLVNKKESKYGPNTNLFVLKQIPLYNMDKEEIESVKQEANILKVLNCKYIVKFHDSFLESKTLNIVMEYCNGGDLSKYLKQKKGKLLKENEIWPIFLKIALGIYYLHSKKIIHRDLKSLNIFLNSDNSIKLGDLGVAKVMSNSFAETYVGTPYYLSPEIVEEKPYNEKSDVWSLGCLLYELITLKHPFNATNHAALYMKIVSGKYEEIKVPCSEELKKSVDFLLEVNPNKRPSAEEIFSKDIIQNKLKEFDLLDDLYVLKGIEKRDNSCNKEIQKSVNKSNLNNQTPTSSSNIKMNKIANSSNISPMKMGFYNVIKTKEEKNEKNLNNKSKEKPTITNQSSGYLFNNILNNVNKDIVKDKDKEVNNNNFLNNNNQLEGKEKLLRPFVIKSKEENKINSKVRIKKNSIGNSSNISFLNPSKLNIDSSPSFVNEIMGIGYQPRKTGTNFGLFKEDEKKGNEDRNKNISPPPLNHQTQPDTLDEETAIIKTKKKKKKDKDTDNCSNEKPPRSSSNYNVASDMKNISNNNSSSKFTNEVSKILLSTNLNEIKEEKTTETNIKNVDIENSTSAQTQSEHPSNEQSLKEDKKKKKKKKKKEDDGDCNKRFETVNTTILGNETIMQTQEDLADLNLDSKVNIVTNKLPSPKNIFETKEKIENKHNILDNLEIDDSTIKCRKNIENIEINIQENNKKEEVEEDKDLETKNEKNNIKKKIRSKLSIVNDNFEPDLIYYQPTEEIKNDTIKDKNSFNESLEVFSDASEEEHETIKIVNKKEKDNKKYNHPFDEIYDENIKVEEKTTSVIEKCEKEIEALIGKNSFSEMKSYYKYKIANNDDDVIERLDSLIEGNFNHLNSDELLLLKENVHKIIITEIIFQRN